MKWDNRRDSLVITNSRRFFSFHSMQEVRDSNPRSSTNQRPSKIRSCVAAENQHLYESCASPDGAYLLLTRSDVNLGRVNNSRTSMMVVPLSDHTPVVFGMSRHLPRPAREQRSVSRRAWAGRRTGPMPRSIPHDPGTLIQHAPTVLGRHPSAREAKNS